MKITYLGTGGSEAIPAVFCQCQVCETARKNKGKEIRARSGAVINDNLLIDVPPDIFYSAVRADISLTGIKDIIFTHSHEDHCDTFELSRRAKKGFANRKDDYTTHVYGNRDVEKRVNIPVGITTLDYTYIEPYKTFKVSGDISVTPLMGEHIPNEDCYIYLLEHDGKRFLYGNDTGLFPESTMEYLKGKYINCISLDCICVMLPSEIGHMGFAANVKLKDMLIKQGTADDKTVFICQHLSHAGFIPDGRYYSLEEFEQIAANDGFIVAYDTMVVEI